jgi:riboflavin biosynthesis pyrimidine reductase
VRQLFPNPVDPVDPVDVYGDQPRAGPGGRPGVRLNMIASVDGATTVAGVSGGLGGAADHDLFALLRSLADVVLVAAGTARAEGYGPSRVPVAVLTRSCRLDWASPFFTAPVARPIVVTVAGAPPDALARAAEVAEVVVAGERDVDRAVLAEGGPTLNAQLAGAGLLDELCLSLSPRLVGEAAKRILDGLPVPGPAPLRLCSVCEQDEFLFLRYQSSARGLRPSERR